MLTLLSVPENLADKFVELFPDKTKNIFTASDPSGTKVGSGGGTAWLLAKHFEQLQEPHFSPYLSSEKKIIIHAGGQSRRLPAYAPSGKILTPVPVFRWSRGQNIRQTLLDLQLPLYEQMMNVAPNGVNTLVASGDVYILTEQVFHSLPDADIICLSIWTDPYLASRHGVFFVARETPHQLDFILQKPAHSRIEKLAVSHLFMMDIGVWLLSDRAVDVLMQKCGWTKNKFENKNPAEYDLYGTFGTCLGNNPSQFDPDISKLSVAVVPLEKGEFFHYGTSAELISSTEKIQNHVKDQRNILHHRIKPHPSLFVQNSITKFDWMPQHRDIWIENSFVPDSWQFQSQHIITGIPENEWNLILPSGFCLDMVPVYDSKTTLRPYGINDVFSGNIIDAMWMGCRFNEWLSKRGIDWQQAGINPAADIQMTPLFPVIETGKDTERLIKWMMGESVDDSEMKELWLNSERLAATDLNAMANLKRLFAQRDCFFAKTMPVVASNYKRSVFYQVNLKQLACDYSRLAIPAPKILSDNENPLVLARHSMFRSELLRNTGVNDLKEEINAFDILQHTIIDSLPHRETPKLNVFSDQIVWGRSPARLDLAGGWSDTPPYSIQSGGAVVNIAVDLNGQPPLQVFVRLSDEYKIVLRSIDNGVSETITTFKQLGSYASIGSAFSIPKAALCLAGFHPKFGATAPSLENMLKEFGGGIEISLLVAIPKGSGLGTSSILAAAILGTLSDFCGLNWDKKSICHRTLILEQMLTTGGGWQDQYGGVFAGIKLLQTVSGLQSDVSISWLPDLLFTRPDFRENWLLYYTGITRVAKSILSEIVRGMFLNEGARLRVINAIKEHAFSIFETIQKNDYKATAQMISRSWQLNNQLDSGTNTLQIQSIINMINDYALGYKLLGAGGGGYLLICAKDDKSGRLIREILEKNPPNNKARFVSMQISETGLQVSRS
ncbi:MAG: hypothetical protein LBV41_12110 [Cytophagaceae bacterium]|jgi:galactokinase/mevalonate kinase-like predicted kinase|nr:hypothetical protein [Cytophagaceae bacterium]